MPLENTWLYLQRRSDFRKLLFLPPALGVDLESNRLFLQRDTIL